MIITGAIQQHSGTDRKSSSIKINLQSLTNTCPGRNIRVQVHGEKLYITH